MLNNLLLKRPVSRLSSNIHRRITNIAEDGQILDNENNETSNDTNKLHIPVLLNEVLDYLVRQKPQNKIFIDMTSGACGHTKAILHESNNSIVYALDRDPYANEIANKIKESYSKGRIVPLLGKFSQMDGLLKQANVKYGTIDGALIDCGCSSIQFDNSFRGFSLSRDGPLDMRMGFNNETTIKASDLVNKLDEVTLGKILWKYGEERHYKRIAHGILYYRSQLGEIKTTKQLADIIATIVKENRSDSLQRHAHVATKTFQALRIFVNNELNELYNGINIIKKYLKPGGRLAVISFHSLEDRIVKTHFNGIDIKDNDNDADCLTNDLQLNKKLKMNLFNVDDQINHFKQSVSKSWMPLNKKVILPSDREIESNPRARSAKLRIAEKI